MKKILYELRTEPNENRFYIKLTCFINDLHKNEDTKEFYLYFHKHYFCNAAKWSYCFRTHVGINTNIYLEALHKRIKYCFLKGM